MTYDLFAARKAGAIVFAVLGSLAMGVLSYLTMGGAVGAVMGLLIGSMLGAMGGWITGHRFAPKPISLYRRVWTLASEEELDLAKGEEPIPGHTRTPAGELVRQTATGYWRQEVYPLRYTNIHGEEAIDDPVVVGGDAALIGTEDKDGSVDPFDPAMIRATTQWEVMQQRIDKMLWGQHHMNTWERIQVGTAVALAAGVVGLAAFLIISTSNPRAPIEEVAWRLSALMA